VHTCGLVTPSARTTTKNTSPTLLAFKEHTHTHTHTRRCGGHNNVTVTLYLHSYCVQRLSLVRWAFYRLLHTIILRGMSSKSTRTINRHTHGVKFVSQCIDMNTRNLLNSVGKFLSVIACRRLRIFAIPRKTANLPDHSNDCKDLRIYSVVKSIMATNVFSSKGESKHTNGSSCVVHCFFRCYNDCVVHCFFRLLQ
jgi:hypothetical protein